MRCSTGIDTIGIAELYRLGPRRVLTPGQSAKIPPVLGLFASMIAAIRYVRTNHTKSEIAETIGRSQRP